MKKKTKKIIGISVVTIAVLVSAGWYFYPLLQYKYFSYTFGKDFEKELSVKPTIINRLPNAPDDWQQYSIGNFQFKLPNIKIDKIDGTSFIRFASSGKIIVLSRIGEKPNEPITFKGWSKIYRSFPEDISIWHSHSANLIALLNLYMKTIAIPNFGSEIYIIETDSLKAIVPINENKGRGNFEIHASLFNKMDTTSVSLIMIYKNKYALNDDIYKILGNIKFPSHPLDEKTILYDIRETERRFNAAPKQ